MQPVRGSMSRAFDGIEYLLNGIYHLICMQINIYDEDNNVHGIGYNA